MKVAIQALGGSHWPAGVIYFRNLFATVRQRYGNVVEFLLQASSSDPTVQEYARAVQVDNVIFYEPLEAGLVQWVMNGIIHRLFSRDLGVERSLRKENVDVLFAPAVAYKYPRVATMVWLPDFQHMRLPGHFSAAERYGRDREFLRSAQMSTRIILMSEAVKQDLVDFAPQYAHKARILRPVSIIPKSIFETDGTLVQEKYSLPPKYIYLPSQFWKHKNHLLVFDAIRLLKDKGTRIVLVCTGNAEDYRHRSYFADLWSNLSLWGIRDQVIYLGLVPHDHVLSLMRQSVCVMNASLFEGWGYTAEEACSVGKRLLLSDIPTHREQNPPWTIYFDRCDSEDLAVKLEQIWETATPGPDLALEDQARQELARRQNICAETFLTIVQEAVQSLS